MKKTIVSKGTNDSSTSRVGELVDFKNFLKLKENFGKANKNIAIKSLSELARVNTNTGSKMISFEKFKTEKRKKNLRKVKRILLEKTLPSQIVNEKNQSIDVEIKDISPFGVRFSSDEQFKLKENEIFKIFIRYSPFLKVAVNLRLIYHNRSKNEWGAEFKPSTENQKKILYHLAHYLKYLSIELTSQKKFKLL